MSMQNYLAEELAVLRQADMIEDAARRGATKGVARRRLVVLPTGAVRRRFGAVVIAIGQRIYGPVVNPPTTARFKAKGGSPSGSSLGLF